MNNFKKIIILLIVMAGMIGVALTFNSKPDPLISVDSAVETETEQMEEQTQNNQKVMYLTFDDGPSEYTEKIVDILDEHKVPATFFFIGKNVFGKEEAVSYAATHGHTIGLHSISHNRDIIYNESDPLKLLEECSELQSYLEPLIGYKTFIIRPPYGSSFMPEVIFNTVGEAGFKFWDWSIDTNDWREETTAESIMTFLNEFPAGEREILLEHELPITLEVLPLIISHYKEKGYVFKAYQPEEHFPYNFHLNDNY